MNNPKKYALLLTFALLISMVATTGVFVTVPASAQATGSDWPQYRYDAQNTGFNPYSSGPFPISLSWSYKTALSIRSSPAIVAGKVYIGSGDTHMYCLDADTGDLIWKFKTGDAVRSSPAVVDGKVYFGSCDYYIYCVDANSGSLIWSYKTGYIINGGSPLVVNGRVYIQSNDNRIYCFDAATGRNATGNVGPLWKFSSRGSRFRSPSGAPGTGDVEEDILNMKPAYWQGRVFHGWYDGYLYANNATTGAQLWEYRAQVSVGYQGAAERDFKESSPMVSPEGAIYIGNYNAYWYKINATFGTVIWQKLYNEALGIARQRNEEIRNSAAWAYGKPYVIWDSPHEPATLDPATGMVTQLYSLMGQLVKSSISVADHKVYIGNNDRYIYVLDADNLNRLQSYDFPQILESTASIANGKVYIGCTDGIVYCLEQADTAKRLNQLTVEPAPRSISLGTDITVTGAVVPYHESGPEGQEVTLHFFRPDGTTVTQTGRTGLLGVYSVTYRPDVEGTWKVMSSWAGNPWWLPSMSYNQTFYVTAAVVKPTTTISASVDDTTIAPGNHVTISGTISPAVAGTLVTLTYTKPDSSAVTRTSVSLADGTYTDTYTPEAEGAWSVKANWAGNDNYQAATSSTATFTVTPTETPTEGGAAIAPEVIYAIVAIIVIAIVAVVAYMFLRKKK